MLGKTVTATVYAARDDKGKLIPNKPIQVRGVLNYIGPNPYLNIPLMIVLNRTPYEIKSLNDIKL